MKSNSLPWHPQVDTGYFYIEDKEYFLYSNKQAIRITPIDGAITLPSMIDFQVVNGPIIITDENFKINNTSGFYSIDDAISTPFAKTYEAPLDDWKPTPHKYERVEDLTDMLESYISSSGTREQYRFELQSYQYTIDYGLPDASGSFTPVITIHQGLSSVPAVGNPVIIEYEGVAASGYYVPRYINFNPIHSPNVTNKFLAIRDTRPSGVIVNLVNETQYLHFPGSTISLIATVYDMFGGTVEDANLYWTLIQRSGATPVSGSFTNHFTTTGWDGSSRNTYTEKNWGPGIVTIPIIQGQAIVCHLINDNNDLYANDTVRIEAGFANV